MDLSKIPNRLRGEPYFCLMKFEKKPGKDKKDKVPYRTNGTRADPTNPEHFTSLENVMKVFDKGGYDGIGIGVFDDVIAIDIDHCVEDGKLNDFARGELSAFKTELVATNNAGMTWGSKFKESIKSYAKFFSGASMIYAISNQVRNASTEAKRLDDSLVNLQKVTDEIADRNALYKYFDKSLKKAQELNVKVGSLIDAVTEFKKLGWSLDNAELGAKWANILSNVGDTNIETAIGSIKTSIASFDEIGGYGNDQMDKKLEAYTDLMDV